MKKYIMGVIVLLTVAALSSCSDKTDVPDEVTQSPTVSGVSGTSAQPSGTVTDATDAAAAAIPECSEDDAAGPSEYNTLSPAPSPSPSSSPSSSPSATPSPSPSSSSSPFTSPSPSPSAADATASAAEAGNDKDLIKFEGTIGASAVHMDLVIKNGLVTGSYYFSNPEQTMKLDGDIEANRMLTMREYDAAGAVTGTFYGWFVPGVRLTGSWADAETDGALEFSLDVIDGIPEGAVWAGEWHRMNTGRFNVANLVIFNESETGFDFQMDAFSGGNMGFLEGTATLAGTTGYYMDQDTGAELLFELKDGIVTLTVNDAANMQGGAGVFFDGKFTKDSLPEDTLLTLGFVTNEAQDKAFRDMVGDEYMLFVNTANIRDVGEDLDGFGADVYAWWVHGFGDYYESIIMFLPSGRFCAGVIDREENVYKIFTNDPDITAVPKTIQAWIDRFEAMPVEFYRAENN